MKFTREDIVAATGAQASGFFSDAQDAGPVVTDSRADVQGAWFVAIVGEHFDGHTFAAQAIEKGALGVIVSHEVAGVSRTLRVADTFEAIRALASWTRRKLRASGVPVVGVSGCAGKTTTRELIAAALSSLGPIHRNRANDNNHLGVPLTLLATPETAACVVLELGSSAPGEMAPLVALTTPDVRVCVNIHEAHLEALGSLEAVRAEEGALLDQAGEHDVVVVNDDDIWLRLGPYRGREVRYGRGERVDVRLLDAQSELSEWQTRAVWRVADERFEGVLPAPGEHIALDATAALAVAHALKVPPTQAIAGFASYKPVGSRLAPVRLSARLLVIDDTYNANPASMLASIALLKTASVAKFAVLGDMLELGPDEAAGHARVLDACEGLDGVVLLGPRMARAAEGRGLQVASDPEQAAAELRLLVGQAPAVVLLKASRGLRLERVLAHLHPGDVS